MQLAIDRGCWLDPSAGEIALTPLLIGLGVDESYMIAAGRTVGLDDALSKPFTAAP